LVFQVLFWSHFQEAFAGRGFENAVNGILPVATRALFLVVALGVAAAAAFVMW
jgi:hypothetical protein